MRLGVSFESRNLLVEHAIWSGALSLGSIVLLDISLVGVGRGNWLLLVLWLLLLLGLSNEFYFDILDHFLLSLFTVVMFLG